MVVLGWFVSAKSVEEPCHAMEEKLKSNATTIHAYRQNTDFCFHARELVYEERVKL